MSREFGEYGSGYFHAKLSNALEDAMGGRTDGAKVMAAFLRPLSEMAYAVSSEEAHDSGPYYVVSEFARALPAIRQAVHALEAYTEPARDYAAEVLANVLRPYATIMPNSPGSWTVRMKRERPQKETDWEVYKAALVAMVRKEHRVNCYWSGSCSRGGTDYTDESLTEWNHADRVTFLAKEVACLKRELALCNARAQ